MDPRDFLDLAARLTIKGAKAANLRTATSRAYYATYHFGARVLEQLNIHVLENHQGHRHLADLLQHAGDEDVAAIGTKLDGLHSARRKADYMLQDRAAEEPKTVQAHIKQARDMITSLQDCLTEPKKSRVGEAIRVWDAPMQQTLATARKKNR